MHLLDYVALATVADVVPLTGENRILVGAGLERLNTTQRPGLIALKKVCAIAVGIRAEPTTTVIKRENWVSLMIPAVKPYSEAMVPKVSPVLIRSVAKVA